MTVFHNEWLVAFKKHYIVQFLHHMYIHQSFFTDKKSKFTVYVFSWNAPDFFENEFDDLKNIEIKAIPKPILEIYKALNG